MSKIGIDKLFKEKFLENEKNSRVYKPDHWKNFEQMLDEKMPVGKKNNFNKFFFILSSLLIVIAIPLLFIYSKGLNESGRNSQLLIPVKRDFNSSAKSFSNAETIKHQDKKTVKTGSIHATKNTMIENQQKEIEVVVKNNTTEDNIANNLLTEALPVGRGKSQEPEVETSDNSTLFSVDLVKQKEIVAGENISPLTDKAKIENKNFIITDSLKKHGKFKRKKAPNPRVDFKGF